MVPWRGWRSSLSGTLRGLLNSYEPHARPPSHRGPVSNLREHQAPAGRAAAQVPPKGHSSHPRWGRLAARLKQGSKLHPTTAAGSGCRDVPGAHSCGSESSPHTPLPRGPTRDPATHSKPCPALPGCPHPAPFRDETSPTTTGLSAGPQSFSRAQTKPRRACILDQSEGDTAVSCSLDIYYSQHLM